MEGVPGGRQQPGSHAVTSRPAPPATSGAHRHDLRGQPAACVGAAGSGGAAAVSARGRGRAGSGRKRSRHPRHVHTAPPSASATPPTSPPTHPRRVHGCHGGGGTSPQQPHPRLHPSRTTLSSHPTKPARPPRVHGCHGGGVGGVAAGKLGEVEVWVGGEGGGWEVDGWDKVGGRQAGLSVSEIGLRPAAPRQERAARMCSRRQPALSGTPAQALARTRDLAAPAGVHQQVGALQVAVQDGRRARVQVAAGGGRGGRWGGREGARRQARAAREWQRRPAPDLHSSWPAPRPGPRSHHALGCIQGHGQAAAPAQLRRGGRVHPPRPQHVRHAAALAVLCLLGGGWVGG